MVSSGRWLDHFFHHFHGEPMPGWPRLALSSLKSFVRTADGTHFGPKP
jgi:hypothetical protein